MSTIQFDIGFEVPAKVIYNALLDPMELTKFTRTLAKMEPKVDGEFKLYDGKIQGKNLELIDGKKIRQEWKFDNWSSYSEVEITFDENEDGCVVQIKQINVPSGENKDKLIDGWKQHIFKPMSVLCGYPFADDI